MINKKNTIISLIALTSSIIIMVSSLCINFGLFSGADSFEPKETITIMVSDGAGFKIKGRNPVEIPKGGTAVFEIELLENFVFTSCSYGQFENGLLTVQGEVRSRTVKILTRDIYYLGVDLNNDDERGEIAISYSKIEQKTILSVTPRSGYEFLCWTKDKRLALGGEMLSAETEIELDSTAKLTVYANYYEDNEHYIMYKANGGKLQNSEIESDFIYSAYTMKEYIRPNTSIGTDLFFNDGFVLTGWNTEADGNGTPCGLGSRFTCSLKMDTLYAQWAKWTVPDEFTYISNGVEIKITSYIGQSQQTVVVPEFIGDKKVTVIGAYCFAATNITTLILPKSIKEVENNAIYGCLNFSTLIMYDDIIDMGDIIINACPAFENLRINAIQKPKYSGTFHAEQANNFDRLMLTQGPRLIIIGGSSVPFGIDPDLIESELGMTAVSLGVTAYFGIRTELMLAESRVLNDDIYLMTPEYFLHMYGQDNYFFIQNWQYLESNYDILCGFRMSEFYGWSESFSNNNKIRQQMPDKTYNEESGDGPYQIKNGFCVNQAESRLTFTLDFEETFSGAFIDDLLASPGREIFNDFADGIIQKGAKVYFSFSPLAMNNIDGAVSKKYTDKFINAYDFPVISSVDDYFYPHTYFYDSKDHLLRDAAKLRTEKLILHIKTQLEKDKETH